MRSASYDDTAFDSSALENNVITLEPETTPGQSTSEWTGPCCEKCNTPSDSQLVTICRRCGWYASLGQFVELDAAWEMDDSDMSTANREPQKSHLRVWLDLLPRWSWTIIATVAVIVVESIAVRLATPAGSSLRTTWSLAQLSLGAITAICCHIFNFVVLSADDADFGILDVLLKPVKLWMRAVQLLPERLWVTNSAISGIVAALMSVIVIGGLPYERLWDWGFVQPPKQNLMGAVMDRAKDLDSRNGADNLEDAISDFAGTADGKLDGELTKEPEKPRRKADCVILGYDVDRDGRLESLELATAHGGRLIYVGRVKPQLPEEELGLLLQNLSTLKTHQPFIPIEAEATWVRPNYACRISYAEQLKGGKLRELQWETLLGPIRAPK